MRYQHLNTDVYSDTLFSEQKSTRGYTCGQLFVTDQEFIDVYPSMLPRTLVTDLAPKETKGEWEKGVKQYLLLQRTTEAHSGRQNQAEIEIHELKKHFRHIMQRIHCCPNAFWGLWYAIHQRNSKINDLTIILMAFYS
jgi:hypothetical protein